MLILNSVDIALSRASMMLYRTITAIAGHGL